MSYLTVNKGIRFINPVFISEAEMGMAYQSKTNPYGKECPAIDYEDQYISEGRQLQWRWWQIELGLDNKGE